MALFSTLTSPVWIKLIKRENLSSRPVGKKGNIKYTMTIRHKIETIIVRIFLVVFFNIQKINPQPRNKPIIADLEPDNITRTKHKGKRKKEMFLKILFIYRLKVIKKNNHDRCPKPLGFNNRPVTLSLVNQDLPPISVKVIKEKKIICKMSIAQPV